MKQQGFTLIEIMIVLAIMGILAAIALPAYQDYVKRSHVFEGVYLASASKFAIYEYYYKNGTWPIDNSAADLPVAASINGNSTRSVAVVNGNIIITYNTKVFSGKTVTLQPSSNGAGSIVWKCLIGADSVPVKYLPYSCRL